MDWLQNLWSWIGGSGGSQQQPKDPNDPQRQQAQAPAAPGPTGATPMMAGGSGATPAAGQRGAGSQAMTGDFAKILAMSLLNTPTLQYPRTAPDMPKATPFAYSPDKTAPLGPRTSLARY